MLVTSSNPCVTDCELIELFHRVFAPGLRKLGLALGVMHIVRECVRSQGDNAGAGSLISD
jgi:hypothetical protein